MENWWKVTMSLKDWTPGGKGQKLIDDFAAIFIANAGPVNAVMFSQKSEDFADAFFYFSPAAIHIAKTLIEIHKPVPCQAPLRGTVNLAAGDVRAVEILLPTPDHSN
jgi:hypothetical protein